MGIEEFNHFKNDFGKSQFPCKEIQGGISVCKEQIQSSLEIYIITKGPDPSLFWLSNEDKN